MTDRPTNQPIDLTIYRKRPGHKEVTLQINTMKSFCIEKFILSLKKPVELFSVTASFLMSPILEKLIGELEQKRLNQEILYKHINLYV